MHVIIILYCVTKLLLLIIKTLPQKHPQMFKEVTFEGLTQFQWDLRLEEIRQSVNNVTANPAANCDFNNYDKCIDH